MAYFNRLAISRWQSKGPALRLSSGQQHAGDSIYNCSADILSDAPRKFS